MEQISTTKETQLPSGIKIQNVSNTEMSELLKNATQMKWPFVGELKGEKPEANAGASTCLMGYVFSKDRGFSGHFTIVRPPIESKYKTPEDMKKENEEYNAYTMWLASIRVLKTSDPETRVILLGQHQSNLSSQIESRTLKEIWMKNHGRVNEDLAALGLQRENIIDLRGPKIGSTAAVYNPSEKRLYYTKYPPRDN